MKGKAVFMLMDQRTIGLFREKTKKSKSKKKRMRCSGDASTENPFAFPGEGCFRFKGISVREILSLLMIG